jgi:hypothetical protein
MTLRWIVDHDPEACRSTSTKVGQIRNVVDMRIDYYDGLAWPPAMYFAPPSVPRSAGSNEVCLTGNVFLGKLKRALSRAASDEVEVRR